MESRARPDYRFLDATRWFSAWLVVLFHLRAPHLERALPIVRSGYLAVDYFFALSGFVMALRYRDEIADRSIDALRFAERRLARLYPLHLATLAVAWVAVVARRALPALAGGAVDVPRLVHEALWPLPGNLLLVQAFGLYDSLTLNGPAWSISAEIAAYAVFFASARALRSDRGLAAFWALLATAGFATLVYLGELDVTYDYGVVRCLAGFGVGVLTFLGARALGFRRIAAPPWVSVPVSLGLLVPLFLGPSVAGEALELGSILVLFLLLVFVDHPLRHAYARFAWLRRASERSYAVYLAHGSLLLGLGFVTARFHGATFRAADLALELAVVLSFVGLVEAYARWLHARIEVPAREAWLARIARRNR